MYIVTNITKINKGEGYKLVDRFNKDDKIEKIEGFLGLEVMTTDKINEYDEISSVTRWDSEAALRTGQNQTHFKNLIDTKVENLNISFLIKLRTMK